MSPSVTLSALCCLLAALSAHSQDPQYEKIGDSVVLSPDLSSVAGPITSIVWKHGPDLAMEWDGRQTEAYRQFKDRGKLNNSTGELSITGLTTDDSGVYTAEINGKVTQQIQLKVIAPVPKPKIFRWCDQDMASCVLSCDGNIRDAEPVTYWWKKGSGGSYGNKELQITKTEDCCRGEISCTLENPVSQESSEPVSNPFIPKSAGEQNLVTIIFSSTAVIISFGLSICIICVRWRKASKKRKKELVSRTTEMQKILQTGREAAKSKDNNAVIERTQDEEEKPMTKDQKP